MYENKKKSRSVLAYRKELRERNLNFDFNYFTKMCSKCEPVFF